MEPAGSRFYSCRWRFHNHGVLTASGISKAYGAVAALDAVSCRFAPGEIHAVLGENGAGKSTLVGVLSGFVLPDSGFVTLDEKPLPLGRPLECRRLGIEMVHQHFTLVPNFTVEENLALSRAPGLASRLRLRELTKHPLEVGEQLGWRLDPRARVADLPVGVQQRIEILKCLAADAPVLIFDEPTAVLSQAEVADLFRVLRDLKAQGKTLILIAHKLAEVMSIADRLTVLRRGKLVAEASITDVTADQLAHWMVGDLPSPGPKGNRKKFDGALNASEVIVRGSRGETAIDRVSFEIKRGEVLGFGGVDGNGQLELAEALVGVRRYSGEIRPRMAQIAYIPQDRQADGLALRMTIEENLLIAGHRRRDLVRHGFLNGKAIRAWSRHLMDKFDIRASSPLQLAEALSGGNQQKVVVSRELDSTPDLLVAVNPTRGLDIQATRFVHQVIRETRDAGTPVALFSADLDELAELADETVFMSRGKLIRGDDAAAVVGGIA